MLLQGHETTKLLAAVLETKLPHFPQLRTDWLICCMEESAQYKAPLPSCLSENNSSTPLCCVASPHVLILRRNSLLNSCLEIVKSLLGWCAVTCLIWIDYQLISDASFSKTLISWQRLNSSPVLLRCRVCSSQSTGWFSQLTLTDLFALASILLSVSPLAALPLTPQQVFLNHALVVNFSSKMNQCFHFSITTAMTTRTGDLTAHAGCKCNFLIAQVCKHREVFFWRTGGCFVFFFFCMCYKTCVGRLR